MGLWVGSQPRLRRFGVLVVEFEFEAGGFVLVFFHVINLGACLKTPEKLVCTDLTVVEQFGSFNKQEVFPQPSAIVPQVDWGEFFYQGIADAQILEKNFMPFGDFFPQIPAVAAHHTDYERFFEQIHVALYGGCIQAELPAEFVERNFASDLECQQLLFDKYAPFYRIHSMNSREFIE